LAQILTPDDAAPESACQTAIAIWKAMGAVVDMWSATRKLSWSAVVIVVVALSRPARAPARANFAIFARSNRVYCVGNGGLTTSTGVRIHPAMF